MRTTGANRTRVRWPDIQNIAFPYPDDETAERFIQHIEDAEAARERARAGHESAMVELNSALALDHPQARFILAAFRPPT